MHRLNNKISATNFLGFFLAITVTIAFASPALGQADQDAGGKKAPAQKKKKKQTAYSSSVPKPTLTTIKYGDHSRNILDLWKAESTEPTPLVLVIHGGGWNGGSKELVHRFVKVQKLLDEKISVAAINYRYIKHAGELSPPVKAPLLDAARALQFARTQASDWNIDKQRIAATGGSAGACSSLWLALHDDLADPNSTDPVARESTRPCCVAAIRAQTTLDPVQMKQWIPNGYYGAHAFGIEGSKKYLAERDNILPWIAEYSPYALVSKDDPPIYLNYKTPPGDNQKDPTHSANYGVEFQKHCLSTGVDCELFYPEAPNTKHDTATEYLIDALKLEP